MDSTRDRLLNWGLYAQDRCGPEGYPSKAAGFISRKVIGDEGYADDVMPDEIPDPVDEKDAVVVDKLISGIKSERLKLALIVEFARAPKSFNFRRYGYTESVDEAIALMDDLLNGQTKKALILDLHAKGKTAPRIAEMVGVSHQYVYQITVCK